MHDGETRKTLSAWTASSARTARSAVATLNVRPLQSAMTGLKNRKMWIQPVTTIKYKNLYLYISTNLSYGRESLFLLCCNFSLQKSLQEEKMCSVWVSGAPSLIGDWTRRNISDITPSADAPSLLTFRRGISLACCTSKWSSLTCCLTSGGTGLQQAMMPWGSLGRSRQNTEPSKNRQVKHTSWVSFTSEHWMIPG